jgi:hypothetical protein
MTTHTTLEERFDEKRPFGIAQHVWDEAKELARQEILLDRATRDRELKASLIADLYEVRASFTRPGRFGEPQPIDELHKYNFYNALIANLSDKYEVDYEDVSEEIKKRSREKDIKALLAESK